MGKIGVRYYTTRARKGGRRVGYWQPTREMMAQGFALVPCGPDGPAAWAVAEEWNRRWDEHRAGRQATRWPVGSLGAAFDALRETGIWADKKARTREDWERGWKYISPVFGDVAPATVTVQMMDRWYRRVLADKGVREAWRAMKIWRALWQQAALQRYCDPTRDPSKAIRRQTPKGRDASWTEGEIARRVKTAWRRGYKGLAACVATAWEGGFSPVDARKVTMAQLDLSGPLVGVSLSRSKTGRPAFARLGRRASALVRAWLATLPENQLPSAIVFRNRSGAAYSKDTLGDDWRDIRGEGETRTIGDIRRSVALEMLAGGASLTQMAPKLANSIDANKELADTYLPLREASIRPADAARKIGRRNIRGEKL